MMLATGSIRRVASRSLSSSKAWTAPPTSHVVRWFASVPADVEGEAPVEQAPPPAPPAAPVQDFRADELKNNLKPSEIVASLDRYIVGQQDAKKAVAIAMRNRWRRRQLGDEIRKEVTPRNVLLVGPTGKIGIFGERSHVSTCLFAYYYCCFDFYCKVVERPRLLDVWP